MTVTCPRSLTSTCTRFSDTDDLDVQAFSVTSNQNQIVPVGHSVQYTTELLNHNNTFDLGTGVYTVPESGYYMFHFFGYDSYMTFVCIMSLSMFGMILVCIIILFTL